MKCNRCLRAAELDQTTKWPCKGPVSSWRRIRIHWRYKIQNWIHRQKYRRRKVRYFRLTFTAWRDNARRNEPCYEILLTKADSTYTWQTSQLIYQSFFRPLTRILYGLTGQDWVLKNSSRCRACTLNDCQCLRLWFCFVVRVVMGRACWPANVHHSSLRVTPLQLVVHFAYR